MTFAIAIGKWLLMSPNGRIILASVGIALALGGLYLWVYNKGVTDTKNAGNATIIKETDDERRNREAIEARERARTDDAATKCLRSPTGC